MFFQTVLYGVCVALLCLMFPFAGARAAESGIDVFTEDLPPFNHLEGGSIKGPAVDIVLALFNKAGIPLQQSDINVVPWARGYHIVLNEADTALFCTARLPEREPHFKWVGPILYVVSGGMVPRWSPLALSSPAALRGRKICVVNKSAGHEWLLRNGFEQEALSLVPAPEASVKMLLAGRCEVLVASVQNTLHVLKVMGKPVESVDARLILHRYPLYLALNPNVSEEQYKALQSAYDSMLCNGGVGGASAMHSLIGAYGDVLPPETYPEERKCPR
ncbi:transporter substrate-binding domain-containing protein [Desulfovibrio mangrovi]|uniref:substrate-binding periplasmic protein n=1 Tax=Desulfovibrio mangrovi TaxID=2976983 RepID=UPI0022455026|nr:transporter substrate-binding domain-containing protein [Desulfovibrio mangrovi]UZP66083.1 transporter substrate-binding domain-containing protein [Desulfovibrio mangrovi]